MAGATAFAFPQSTGLLSAMNHLTSLLISVGIFMFIPVSFVTFAAGTASLRKDRIGGKVFWSSVLWAVVSSLLLSILAICVVTYLPLSFPVTSSAGGDYISLYSEYAASYDILGASTLTGSIFPVLLAVGLIFGLALTPSSDVIRPAYAVLNSLSEVMYRIERTVTYFGAFFVYTAGTAFFLNIWQEKTAFVSPTFFLTILISALALVLVVLPLLYLIFTGFRKNPYVLIWRSLPSLIFGFVSGSIYLSALQDEAVERNNLGVQKRIVSFNTPLSILITRGGTAFVSTITVLSILNALNAEVTLHAAILIALMTVCLSFLSFMSAGTETAITTILLFRVMNINVYGAEAAVISIIPFLNGVAVMLDVLLINMSSSIGAKRTKTDVRVPGRDVI